MKKAVFIDKDGTLVEDVPYNIDITKIMLTEGAIEALRQLQRNGYLLIIVSNQGGIARHYFSESLLLKYFSHLSQILEARKVFLTDICYCPYDPQGDKQYLHYISWRKPQPGMLVHAAAKWNISLENSWMVGDILDDVEAGNRSGCRTVLLDNGNETEWQSGPYRQPDFRHGSWQEISDTICLRT